MIKSQLIATLAKRCPHIARSDLERGVNTLLRTVIRALARGERVEVRGFGSFSLRYRPPRKGFNLHTGTHTDLPGRYHVHFRPARALRQRVIPPVKAPETESDPESHLLGSV